MTPSQKWEIRERVRLALQRLPPELREGKRYIYYRLVAKLVLSRDNKERK